MTNRFCLFCSVFSSCYQIINMSTPYVCKLDQATQDKARKELNEDPKNRQGAIDTFRKWILEQKHFKCPTGKPLSQSYRKNLLNYKCMSLCDSYPFCLSTFVICLSVCLSVYLSNYVSIFIICLSIHINKHTHICTNKFQNFS